MSLTMALIVSFLPAFTSSWTAKVLSFIAADDTSEGVTADRILSSLSNHVFV